MERFRMAVGRRHGVKPANIVGAIANEAGLASRYIGRVEIDEEYSTVDLPLGMPKQILRILKRAWVCQQQLRMVRVTPQAQGAEQTAQRAKPAKRKHRLKRRRSQGR